MINHFRIVFVLTLFGFYSSCSSPKVNNEEVGDKTKTALLQTDRDFSAMSVQKGMKTAFLEYIDSNGILLRPDVMPIIGAESVDYLIAQNDTSYIMQWIPRDGSVSNSGDMGYTYGTYELYPKAKDTVLYGTYVSIWKKQADGKWKFVLDSGNEGVGK